MKLKNIKLTDTYELTEGTVYMTGNQALARLPMLQAQKDKQKGLNTAGYITGYRGSPIGTYDYELQRQKTRLEELGIVFQPGVNEDLAATSIWGTQQVEVQADKNVDGVFSLWYAKAPGVFRSGDALKHGNHYGASANGGVLIVPGDDHIAKSSTIANYSDPELVAHSMPFLYPTNIQEVIDYGLMGWALSRYSGAWVGLKLVNDTIEGTATVDISLERSQTEEPQDLPLHPKTHYVPPQTVADIAMSEVMANEERIKRVRAFARLNKFDKTIFNSSQRKLGIIASGKSYQDVRAALQQLGITPERAEALGITLYKVAMPWPLDVESFREYAEGHEHLLVIEEKQPLMESQIALELVNLPDAKRPTLCGKQDAQGNALLPNHGGFDTALLTKVIYHILETNQQSDDAIAEAYDRFQNRFSGCSGAVIPQVQRIPWFCSGCPHNTSTKVPEGHKAGAGIGCHAMASYMQRNTEQATQMGGEGHSWIGMSHFVDTPHRFQNLGDGTYTHSGLLAIHGAVCQKANITYKILYNDAVAMTGGQTAEGELSVDKISRQVHGLGVKRIEVVTDEPEKYKHKHLFAKGTGFHHRRKLDAIQKELAATPGVTVLIYDQTCAAEKRRRRKRGQFPDPAKRMFINDAVCEACGDCSVKSNCMSIQTKTTELGNKRVIEQSSCNKDYSCAEGFCPSFVAVEGGKLRKAVGQTLDTDLFSCIPSPQLPQIEHSYAILINGVGGSGVVTIGAVLGMAAHLEDKAMSIYDMTGMAQKGGAVQSHLRIGKKQDDINALSIGAAEADLILGCDLVVSAGQGSMQSIAKGHTAAVVNTDPMETAHLQLLRDYQTPNQILKQGLQAALGDKVSMIDASSIAVALTGDAIAANMFLVGFAFQKGYVPLSEEAILKAIEINRVAIEFNQQAFQLGRVAAHDFSRIEPLLASQKKVSANQDLSKTPEEAFQYRYNYLVDYQNKAYAEQYRTFVESIQAQEAKAGITTTEFSDAVAKSLFKLMTYKDEYEVARLYSLPSFKEKLNAQFEGNFSIRYKLAPPLLAKKDSKGHLQKMEFGSYMGSVFKILAKCKGLRGTALDIFGYTAERKMERALITEYRDTINSLVGKLCAEKLNIATQIAALPMDIRGYGHVKEAAVDNTRIQQKTLLETFHQETIAAVNIHSPAIA